MHGRTSAVTREQDFLSKALGLALAPLMLIALALTAGKAYADFTLESANSSLVVQTNRQVQDSLLPDMEWVVDGRTILVDHGSPFAAFVIGHEHANDHENGILGLLPNDPQQAFEKLNEDSSLDFFDFVLNDSQGHARGSVTPNQFFSISGQAIYGIVGGPNGSGASRVFQWLILDYKTSAGVDPRPFFGCCGIDFDGGTDLSGLAVTKNLSYYSEQVDATAGQARVMVARDLIVEPAATPIPEPSRWALMVLGLLLLVPLTRPRSTRFRA